MIANLFNKSLLQMKKLPYQIIDYNWAVGFYRNLSGEDEIEGMTADQSAALDASTKDNIPIVDETVESPYGKKALFCRKCGANLLSDSLFCSYCGAKVVY